MSKIKSYAAAEAGADLELCEIDAGELGAGDVEVTVEYCGICHSDLSMIDNEWEFQNIHWSPAMKWSVASAPSGMRHRIKA